MGAGCAGCAGDVRAEPFDTHLTTGHLLLWEASGPWRKTFVVLFRNSNLIWFDRKHGLQLGRVKLRTAGSLLMVGPACRRIPTCPQQLPKKMSYSFMMAVPHNYVSNTDPNKASMLYFLAPNCTVMEKLLGSIYSVLHHDENIPLVTEDSSQLTYSDLKLPANEKGFFEEYGLGFGYNCQWNFGWGWNFGYHPLYGHGYKNFDFSMDYDDFSPYECDVTSVANFGGSQMTLTSSYYNYNFDVMSSSSRGGFAADDVDSYGSAMWRNGSQGAAAVADDDDYVAGNVTPTNRSPTPRRN